MSTQKILHFLKNKREPGVGRGKGEPSLYSFDIHQVLIIPECLLHTLHYGSADTPRSNSFPLSIQGAPNAWEAGGLRVLGAEGCADPLEKPIPRQRCFPGLGGLPAASAQGPDAAEELGIQFEGAEKQFLDQQPGGALSWASQEGPLLTSGQPRPGPLEGSWCGADPTSPAC